MRPPPGALSRSLSSVDTATAARLRNSNARWPASFRPDLPLAPPPVDSPGSELDWELAAPADGLDEARNIAFSPARSPAAHAHVFPTAWGRFASALASAQNLPRGGERSMPACATEGHTLCEAPEARGNQAFSLDVPFEADVLSSHAPCLGGVEAGGVGSVAGNADPPGPPTTLDGWFAAHTVRWSCNARLLAQKGGGQHETALAEQNLLTKRCSCWR